MSRTAFPLHAIPALKIARIATLGVAALLSACASAPVAHPPYPVDLGLPQVLAPLPPAVLAHLDGEPKLTVDARP